MIPFSFAYVSLNPGVQRSLLAVFIFATLMLNREYCFSQAVSISSGSWFATATWAGGTVPAAGETVTISANDSVVIDSTTEIINDINVNGRLNIIDSSFASLRTAGSVIVNGTLTNNGNFQMTVAGKNFMLNAGSTYVHNPRNNIVADEMPFINSVETLDSSSTLIIQRWANGFVPLGSPSRVSGNFGNVTLSAPITWSQQGYFNSHKIKGTLTVTDGNIVMDDGSAVISTFLILYDVVITGNGSITFQTGFNRPLALTTGNFTDNSNSIVPTTIMNGSFGNLNFTVNGNLNLSHDFSAVIGTYSEPGGNPQINVAGNFMISGGAIELIKQADANLLLNVSGTTTITGSPSKVRFIDGNTGSLTFNTGYLTVSGGNANSFLGGNPSVPKATGATTINIGNDLLINGASNTIVANSDTTINKTRINVGRDFIMNGTGSIFSGANTNGAITFKVAGNFTMTTGKFSGQINPLNVAHDSIMVGANFSFNTPTASDYFRANSGGGPTIINTTGNFNVSNSGTGIGEGVTGIFTGNGNLNFSVGGFFLQDGGQFSGICNGGGNLVFTIDGILDMNAGIFKGVNNTSFSITGTVNFTVNAIDYEGGFFSGFYASNYNSGAGTFTVANDCKVNFTSASDQFSFSGLAFVPPNNNSLLLNLIIKGDLIISGSNGTFVSSHSEGAETIIIRGNVNISNGNNSFNSVQASGYPNGHAVSLTVSKNINISGGNTFLSAMLGNLAVIDSGNVSVTGGTLSVKGGDGAATLNILGGYSQPAGTFYLHNAPNDGTSNSVTVNINSNDDSIGDFIHSGGTISFENCILVPPAANSTNVSHVLNIYSPAYTIGPAGTMTSAFAGNGLYFGLLNFDRTGTTSFTRSGTHNIQQVKQSVITDCTLDIVSGNFQVASYNTAALDLLSLLPNATVALRTNQIYSNATSPNSGILLYQGSRLRIQHPNGLYNNTTAAAISNAGNMNYYLDVKSTVEYYGTHNQVISGTGLGNALLFYHRYGILEVNFGGIPDSEFIYPTNNPNINSVFVRTQLNLVAGELNLDNDHDHTNSGGRIIYISNDSTTGIVRTGGYVRSEIDDGSGIIKWQLNSKTGAHVFPFGYNSSNYIPFTFNPPAGTSGEITVATYHTDSANMPWPAGVTQLNNGAGSDNFGNTVDRFWYLNVSGSVSSADLTFVAAAGEMGTIVSPLAQRWISGSLAWEPPMGTQSDVTNGTQAIGITHFPNWWTLAGNSSPLPVELISFKGECDHRKVILSWVTASEVHNDYFTVEKSPDGIHYQPIGTINGAGNSSTQNNYSLADEHPYKGYGYYRLRQTDYDGHFIEYGPVVIRNCEDKAVVTVSIYTGAGNATNLLIDSPYEGLFTIAIFDVNAKKLFHKTVAIEKGGNLVNLDLSGFSAGVYFVNVAGKYDVISKKFVFTRL